MLYSGTHVATVGVNVIGLILILEPAFCVLSNCRKFVVDNFGNV